MNYKPDIIAKLAVFVIAEMLRDVLVETTKVLCTEKMLVSVIKEREDWQTLIILYLRDDTLPLNLKEVKKVIRLSRRFALRTDDELCRRFFS